MDVLLQILASGLTLGAVYAISTVGLALVFGAMNMLNMSMARLWLWAAIWPGSW